MHVKYILKNKTESIVSHPETATGGIKPPALYLTVFHLTTLIHMFVRTYILAPILYCWAMRHLSRLVSISPAT